MCVWFARKRGRSDMTTKRQRCCYTKLSFRARGKTCRCRQWLRKNKGLTNGWSIYTKIPPLCQTPLCTVCMLILGLPRDCISPFCSRVWFFYYWILTSPSFSFKKCVQDFSSFAMLPSPRPIKTTLPAWSGSSCPCCAVASLTS